MKDCPACLHQNVGDAKACDSCGYTFDSALDREKTTFSEVDISGFAAGDFIAERYHVVRELGRGGMGVVYLVRDAELRERQVALKMIHANLIAHPEARQRFEEEVIICQQLTHRNIVRVHDLKRWQDLRFFTMEYISGRSLRELLNERKDTEPPFTLPEVISVIDPLLEALSYAHRYTIHRDIKPENIMVLGEFPNVKIKVLDFGIAKTLSASRFTQTAQALGTAYYMAPEQMTGAKEEIDHRVDLYSVGMIFYEMLTGKMAVGRFRLPGELVRELPGEIDKLVEKALAPEPEGRFQSAEEMREAFQVVLSAHKDRMEEFRRAEISRQREAKIDAFLREGQAVMKARKWIEAEDIFGKVLELEPEHDQAVKLLEIARAKKRRLEGLLRAVEEAQQSGDLEKAISLFEKIMPLSADQIPFKQRRLGLERRLEEQRQKAERRRQAIEEKRLAKERRIAEEKKRTEQLLFEEEEKVARKQAEQRLKRTKYFIGGALWLLLIGIVVVVVVILKEEPKESRHRVSPPPQLPEVQSKGRLYVDTEPQSARVRIMNIKPKYERGMELNPERYHIEVSANGYETKYKWIPLAAGEDKHVRISLVKLPNFTNSIGIKFVLIPEGTFTMGSPSGEPKRDEDERQHKVTIGSAFYLQTTEVTQGQWKRVMGNNPSRFKNCGDNCPVENVTWYDAQRFIKKLNRIEGTDKYRLSTEAEWEYACRAGTSTTYSFGYWGRMAEYAWYGVYSTHRVAQKKPNAWGLYDMHGNVWEWCQDWYGNYSSGHVTDPDGASSGNYRVLRGGSCLDYA